MLTLIHGDDITPSRNFYIDIKSKAHEQIVLDGAKVTITDLTQALEGQDLFGDTKHIFIEELLSKRKPSKEVDALVCLLINSEAPITLWESKELTPKQIGNFKKAAVKQFKIPATIFTLLDALKPHNGKLLIELFHKTLEDKEAEFVFFMLQRQVRILLGLKPNVIASEAKQSIRYNEIAASSSAPRNDDIPSISEVSRIAPWQKGKLEKQAGMFTQEELLNFHSKLFNIEIGLKTGNLSLPLIPTIDLLLLAL